MELYNYKTGTFRILVMKPTQFVWRFEEQIRLELPREKAKKKEGNNQIQTKFKSNRLRFFVLFFFFREIGTAGKNRIARIGVLCCWALNIYGLLLEPWLIGPYPSCIGFIFIYTCDSSAHSPQTGNTLANMTPPSTKPFNI